MSHSTHRPARWHAGSELKGRRAAGEPTIQPSAPSDKRFTRLANQYKAVGSSWPPSIATSLQYLFKSSPL